MLDLSIIWFLAVGGGTLALAIAVGYILVTRRKLTEDEKIRQDLGSRAIYEEEDRKPD